MLSIISAIKGRPELTKKCFEKIWEMADDPFDIEHVIAVDCNDGPLINYINNDYQKFVDKLGLFNRVRYHRVCFCKREFLYPLRSISRDYWNPIAKMSIGNIVFGLTNDCEILTKGYDTILKNAYAEHVKRFHHSYFQFVIDDDGSNDIESRHNKFCSWIILSRSAVNLIDGILPPEMSFAGSDQYIYRIFDSTYIKSQINLYDKIKTKHISHYNGSAELDYVSVSHPVQDQFRIDFKENQQKLFQDNYYGQKLDNAIMKEVLEWKFKNESNLVNC